MPLQRSEMLNLANEYPVYDCKLHLMVRLTMNVEYPLIDITAMFTLTKIGSTC